MCTSEGCDLIKCLESGAAAAWWEYHLATEKYIDVGVLTDAMYFINLILIYFENLATYLTQMQLVTTQGCT